MCHSDKFTRLERLTKSFFVEDSPSSGAYLELLVRAEDEVVRYGVDDLALAVNLPLQLPTANVFLLGAMRVLQDDELALRRRFVDGDVALGGAGVGLTAGRLALHYAHCL